MTWSSRSRFRPRGPMTWSSPKRHEGMTPYAVIGGEAGDMRWTQPGRRRGGRHRARWCPSLRELRGLVDAGRRGVAWESYTFTIRKRGGARAGVGFTRPGPTHLVDHAARQDRAPVKLRAGDVLRRRVRGPPRGLPEPSTWTSTSPRTPSWAPASPTGWSGCFCREPGSGNTAIACVVPGSGGRAGEPKHQQPGPGRPRLERGPVVRHDPRRRPGRTKVVA